MGATHTPNPTYSGLHSPGTFLSTEHPTSQETLSPVNLGRWVTLSVISPHHLPYPTPRIEGSVCHCPSRGSHWWLEGPIWTTLPYPGCLQSGKGPRQ